MAKASVDKEIGYYSPGSVQEISWLQAKEKDCIWPYQGDDKN
jgi:hypothetical protein